MKSVRVAPVDAAPTELDPLVRAAEDAFGVRYLYPYQRLVISNVLEAEAERRRQLVVLPTGSGKSLCFMLPMLLLPRLTVVVYPLLALMEDQRRRMTQSGISVRIVRGGQSAESRRTILREITAGDVRCVIVNPEVLLNAGLRTALRQAGVDHMVVDEAHCVSEWGTTFRSAYLTLAESMAEIRPRMVTAFTATASPPVLDSVQGILFGYSGAHLIQGDPDRPNIAYHVVRTTTREATLHRLLTTGAELPALVFCRSRKRTEGVARELAEHMGFERVGCYHAGLSRDERDRIEQWFFSSRDGVLAATCAYGMGVDKADVRTVVHYEPPSSVEAFLQESGRAGRDGRRAVSIVLWNLTDAPHETEPTRRERERIMFGYLSTSGCRREYLLGALGAGEVTCFGCDRCSDHMPEVITSVRESAQVTEQDLIRFVRRNRRRFTGAQLARRFGDWHAARVQTELMAALFARGSLRLLRHGPWRGRVTAGRSRDRTTSA